MIASLLKLGQAPAHQSLWSWISYPTFKNPETQLKNPKACSLQASCEKLTKHLSVLWYTCFFNP
jgi:hypothetical protein